MKTKTAYWISAQKRIKDNDGQINYVDRSQYLLPNELHLIKTMLNDDVFAKILDAYNLEENPDAKQALLLILKNAKTAKGNTA